MNRIVNPSLMDYGYAKERALVEHLSFDDLAWDARVDSDDINVIRNCGISILYANTPLGSTDVWLDCGAGIGSFGLSIASKVRKVICVEPSHPNISFLKQNISMNMLDNVATVQACVGEYDAQALFYHPDGKKAMIGSAIYPPKKHVSIVTKMITLDMLIEKFKPNKMKMDIVGYEQNAIMESKLIGRLSYIILRYYTKTDDELIRFDILMDYLHMTFGFIPYYDYDFHKDPLVILVKNDKRTT